MPGSASQSTVAIGFVTIVMLMLLMSLIGIALISNRTSDIEEVITENDRKQNLIINMRRASRERTVSLQKMVILSDVFSRNDELRAFWQHASDFIQARDQLAGKLEDEKEKALFDKVMNLVQINAPRQNEIARGIMTGQVSRAKNALESEIIPRQVEIYERLTELLRYQSRIGASAVSRARQIYQNTLWSVSLLSILTIILSATIAHMVIRKICQTEQYLADERERAHITLHSIGDGVVTTDTNGAIHDMNNIAEILTGFNAAEVRDSEMERVIPLVNEFTNERIPDPVKEALHEESIVSSGVDAVLFNKDGKRFAVEYTAAPVTDSEKNIKGGILVLRDVSEIRELSRELAFRARHDPLTGLLNRSELEEALSKTLAHIRRNKELQAWLCYLDLDQFKVINDTSGHIAGDELIKQVANVLRNRLRDTDFISRIGGDEYAFIIMDADEDAALNLVEEICSNINSIRFSWKDKAYPVSASFGLVSIRPDSGSVQDLLSAVDSACYISKEQGRNRIHVYRPDDNLSARQSMEMAMVHKINHAIDHGMFVLHYHPIISLSGTDDSVRYEILLRMQDDDKSWILPGAFIPAAERYCLMSRIDRWVVHSVLQSSHSVVSDDVWVSINISAQSLSESSFLDYVLDELAISRIPPANICFEITETTAISNLTAAMSFIKAIKSRGCLFSLDDFGSGLCSFGYLRQMSVDFIKIDGTFVKDVFNDSINVAMIESIVNIAHVLGVKTIAEFVASPEILQKVRDLGVDYAQGHSISDSMPLEDLVSLSDLSNG